MRPTALSTTTTEAPGATTRPGQRPRPLPLATSTRARLRVPDIATVAAAVTLLVVGLWARGGGFSDLAEGGTVMWTSLARITGRAASGAGLAPPGSAWSSVGGGVWRAARCGRSRCST